LDGFRAAALGYEDTFVFHGFLLFR
jgi:hypothetical protein